VVVVKVKKMSVRCPKSETSGCAVQEKEPLIYTGPKLDSILVSFHPGSRETLGVRNLRACQGLENSGVNKSLSLQLQGIKRQ
jgi:hypothetical protein